MREIEFRAWDNLLRQMMTSIENAVIMARRSEFEVMQYTGLKDKNSIPIYEGDIIKLGDEDAVLRVVVFNHHQAGFMLRWLQYYDDDEDFMHADYFSELHPDRVSREVIGNIYENPELLKN